MRRAMPDALHSPKAASVLAGDSSRLFDWPRQITGAERKSLIAGGLGWMLDAMDVMLYSLVIAYLIREFSMDTRTAGFLNSLTLVASAIGGLLFGIVADRIGRTRSLMASILLYSLASAACAFSHSITQLAVFRFVLGLGMGGEWTAAAALIAETWRPEHRGKALGLMQSAYAIGEAIAALVVRLVLPNFGWRAVFLVGVLPALLVFWIQSSVPEPTLWSERQLVRARRPPLRRLLSGRVLRRRIRRQKVLLHIPADCGPAGPHLRNDQPSHLTAASRAACCVLRNGIFFGIRRDRQRNLPRRNPR